MGRLNRFQILARKNKDIKECFKELSKRTFSIPELKKIYREKADGWEIPRKTKFEEFLKHLLETEVLKQIEIELPRAEKLNKYVFGEPTLFEIANSIKSKAYLSHYTAMFLHGLTDNLPKTIYTNTELKMSKNLNTKELEQSNIDRVFALSGRQSNQIAKYEDVEIYLLNSKNVEHVGVKEFEFDGIKLRVTDIERTLIDITVRPNYAGGIQEVLNAFAAAKDKVSVNRLIAILKKLDYTYPYHQVIGFYMEKSGYDETALGMLEKLEIKYNFYLTYQIESKDYSERWKLYYPRFFDLID